MGEDESSLKSLNKVIACCLARAKNKKTSGANKQGNKIVKQQQKIIKSFLSFGCKSITQDAKMLIREKSKNDCKWHRVAHSMNHRGSRQATAA